MKAPAKRGAKTSIERTMACGLANPQCPRTRVPGTAASRVGADHSDPSANIALGRDGPRAGGRWPATFAGHAFAPGGEPDQRSPAALAADNAPGSISARRQCRRPHEDASRPDPRPFTYADLSDDQFAALEPPAAHVHVALEGRPAPMCTRLVGDGRWPNGRPAAVGAVHAA